MTGPDVHALIKEQRWGAVRDELAHLHPSDIAEMLMVIPKAQGVRVFCDVPRELSGEVFAHLSHEHQEMLMGALSPQQIRAVLTEMSPDDEARVLEGLTPAINRRALASISPNELNAINELLKYPPHSTGRYMTPRYLTIRMDMTAREGLAHVRDKGRGMETVDVLYVLDDHGKLIKDMNLGSLVLADPTATVRDIPGSGVALKAMTDREETLRAFEKYDRFVLPVTDDEGRMLGIVTIDDILDVAAKETTEDLQKLSGLGALDEPYLEVGYLSAIRQRGGWLSILFFGEMLTATAMGFYEKEIAAAVVLALFVPLIISSGGNSGSQAATLVVRSLALGDLKLRDWYRVLGRELRSSMTLGVWLGMLGFVRIVLWQQLGWAAYGQHYLLVGTTVWLALVGVVCFGSVVGSMLPFLLKRLGFDPATSSAPFVATLVDVTGLIIYFTCAIVILRGTLL